MELRNQNSGSLWLREGTDWKGALGKFLALCGLYSSLVTCGSEHVRRGYSELKCSICVKYTPDSEDFTK